MRECREDLVVDLAEILFNELAFFRLMQDLEPNSMMKTKATQWQQVSHNNICICYSWCFIKTSVIEMVGREDIMSGWVMLSQYFFSLNFAYVLY